MNFYKLIAVFITLLSINTYAQNEFKFGIKGGINFSGFHTENSVSTDNFGFNIGTMSEFEFSESLSLLAELLYSKKGGLFNVNDPSNSTFFSIDTQLDYIELPIQGVFYFSQNLGFNFGPQIGFLIDNKGEIVNSNSENGDEVEFTDTNLIDFNISGGFTYKNNDEFLLQIRYSYGLTKIFKNENYKNSTISLSLGYFFL